MEQGVTPRSTLEQRMRYMPTTKHRVAVNLDDEEFAILAEMAEKHDVSLGWLGRQAFLEFIDRYRNEQLPLPLRREVRHPHHPRPSDYAKK